MLELLLQLPLLDTTLSRNRYARFQRLLLPQPATGCESASSRGLLAPPLVWHRKSAAAAESSKRPSSSPAHAASSFSTRTQIPLREVRLIPPTMSGRKPPGGSRKEKRVTRRTAIAAISTRAMLLPMQERVP